MREYIPKEYRLQRWVYQSVLATVRGYDDMIRRMRATADEVAYAVPTYRGDGGVGKPTETKAIMLAKRNEADDRRTMAVEQALLCFAEEDRKVILDSIRYKTPIKRSACLQERDRTMARRKQQFVFLVAQNLHLV